MEIRWLGHSAFEIISDEGVKILIDPFISNNPVCTIPVEDIEADIICITHGHSDHFGDAMEIANKTGAVVLTNHEISLFLGNQGIDAIGMNIGGSVSSKGIKFTMLDAKHSSSIDFTEELTTGGNPASFLITLEDGTKIFHAGDTGLFSDLQNVIGKLYKPDIAMVPIGDRFTMGPFEAALATMWLSPKLVLPMHYNTFPAVAQDPVVFSNFVKQLAPTVETLILNPLESCAPKIEKEE
ncbi:MAG: metal-dependent hydrolase [Methanobacteriaceae archaeon]|nr:metal-dependent hydrolase [Methanobacteriaceae archaeon]